jgi:outer membrane usher protein
MRCPLSGRRIELVSLIVAVTLTNLVSSAQHVQAAQGVPLQLEVILNQVPTNLVGSFVEFPDRRIGARSSELAELGIKLPGRPSGEEAVVLDDIAGIAYRYDEPAQKIFIKAADELLVTKVYDVRGKSAPVPVARADYGAVMNYALFASSAASFPKSAMWFSGANASVDSRVFGPYGTLSQTAILGSTPAREASALRLDTTWSYSDPDSLKTYRTGDVISGGLAWTRPIRLGGLQLQRNFSLRPDLVTMPLPAIGGSAAVPSTLEVYVNNLKVHTQDVPPGPYQLTNLPIVTGAGEASVVLRDAAGRPTALTVPFFASPKLLQPGLTDFSLEAGLPRVRYASESNAYLQDPVGSATLRAGIHDWLTAEAHVESGMGLVNGGLGAVARVGTWGVISAAGATSQIERRSGYQSYFAFDTQIGKISLHLSSQHAFGAYDDLASVSARYLPPVVPILASSYLGYVPSTASARPPKFIDAISVGTPLRDGSTVSLGFLHVDLRAARASDVVNLSYSRAVLAGGSAYVSTFTDLNDRKTFGIFGGLTFPIGGKVTVSAGVTSTRQGTNYTFDAAKPLESEPGSYGWRVRDSEGSIPNRFAGGSYRSSIGQIDGTVQQVGSGGGGSVLLQGAVATLGGGVFLSNRIDDAFAVVDAGAPGVDVLYENRPAGQTDARGRLLIPSLRSYQNNTISIDPRGLPVDADAPVTQSVVAPVDRSGVVVGFGVKTDVAAAVVVLVGKDGKFIAPGSEGRLDGADETFVVGYDGRTYVQGLGATNTLVIAAAAGECRATFPFAAQDNSQVMIGPLVCQ